MSESPTHPDQEPENVGRELSKPGRDERDNASADDDPHRNEQNRASRKEDILAKLEHLAACVVIGVVPTQRANAMRGIYATILSNLNDAPNPGAASLSNDEVLEFLRGSPKSLKLIEPFLTKEQIDLIIRKEAHGQ
jgi:hypothetical protein